MDTRCDKGTFTIVILKEITALKYRLLLLNSPRINSFIIGASQNEPHSYHLHNMIAVQKFVCMYMYVHSDNYVIHVLACSLCMYIHSYIGSLLCINDT